MGYVFGMDIGVASCGWAVTDLEKGRIVDLGIRVFDKAENPKTGESLNKPRRDARSQRRRLQRRSERLQLIRSLFLSERLFETEEEMIFFFDEIREYNDSVWELRVTGLDQLLQPGEWARVLIRIAKRRGYQSNRRLEATEQDSEKQAFTGIVSEKIHELKRHQLEGGYRTVGEALARHEAYREYKRNRHSQHRFHIDRAMLIEEITALFEAQRRYGSLFASERFEEAYKKLAFEQRPFATKELLLSKVGRCTFEKDEYRAPKHSRSAELFVLLQKINHLRLNDNGMVRELTKEQREIVFHLAHTQREVKYGSIRKALHLGEQVRFGGLTYSGKTDKQTENAKFIEMRFYHDVKTALQQIGEAALWDKLQRERELFDHLGGILTLCKNDFELEEEFSGLGWSDVAVKALQTFSYSGFTHLSFKAYAAILPYLEEGSTYDKACAAAGYDFTAHHKQRHKFLPVIPGEDIRNPVVYRAITQARKVLNGMVGKYGTPVSVHIEVARELSKSFEERNQIRKTMEHNRADKEKLSLQMKEIFPIFKHKDPKAFDILKYRLFKEQQGQCVYSGKRIDPGRLFEDGYVEVDHILPMSRTMDDSYLNKVLVLQAENRNKRNQTPYEWLGADHESWAELTARIKILPYKKQLNLLRKTLNDEHKREFLQRNLNDTRYIARYFSQFVRDQLMIESGKVICVNGQLTSFLRTRFGLGQLKNRSEDVHHALDALIVSIANEATIKRASEFHKRGELAYVSQAERWIDPETGELVDEQYLNSDVRQKFPLPWPDFRYEVLCRFGIDPRDKGETARLHDPKELVRQLSLSAYVGLGEREWGWVRPIFVSRAPNRKVTGKAHQDTIKGLRWQGNVEVKVKKTSLLSIVDRKKTFTQDEAAKIIDQIYGEDPALRSSVEAWLTDGVNLQEKIKQNDFPRKPSKSGLGPVIRSVKLMEKSLAGVRLHGGKAIAENDSMVRADVFEKEGKYYIVPVYVADTVKQELPNRAAKAGKEESEWDVMDETFAFRFSLFKNDLIELEFTNKYYLAYFAGFDRATASITLLTHDRSEGKEGRIRSIGIKTGVKRFSKLNVDPLGYYNYVKGEKRLGFSKRSR